MKRSYQKGFTLVELIVVVLIVGMLAALAVPQYIRSMESSKADDALSAVQMIATTNRMFNLDKNRWTVGLLTTAATCGACPPGAVAVNQPSGCLMACGYLANQDFSRKPYDFYSCDPSVADAVCCNGGGPGVGAVACAKRRSGVSPGTNNANFQTWQYQVSETGIVTPYPLTSGPPAPGS